MIAISPWNVRSHLPPSLNIIASRQARVCVFTLILCSCELLIGVVGFAPFPFSLCVLIEHIHNEVMAMTTFADTFTPIDSEKNKIRTLSPAWKTSKASLRWSHYRTKQRPRSPPMHVKLPAQRAKTATTKDRYTTWLPCARSEDIPQTHRPQQDEDANSRDKSLPIAPDFGIFFEKPWLLRREVRQCT